MYIGIGCIAIGAVFLLLWGIHSIIKDKFYPILPTAVVLILGIIGSVFINQPFDNPDYKIAPYSADTGDGRIFFSSFERSDNDLIIPAYYHVKVSWLNTWEYCGSSIIVDVPDGQCITVIDHTPEPVSHIIGGCK